MGANPVKSRNIELFPKKLWIHNSALSTKVGIMVQEKWCDVGYRMVQPGNYEYFDALNLDNGIATKGVTVNNCYCFNKRDGNIREAFLRFSVEFVFHNSNTGYWFIEGRVVNNGSELYSFDTVVCSYAVFLA